MNPTEKFLIFTEYRGTLKFLRDTLINRYGEGCLAAIMGGMGTEARREAMRQFREDPSCKFLISTEAGGEGINLQFCNIVVNFDLPWNPFRVAQRIGRVHRIGQKRDMQVFNYRLRGEVDERLSDCHDQRVETAVTRLSEVTGLDASDIRDQLLGFAQEFINYEKVFSEALTGTGARSSENEIAEGVKRAEQAFKLAYETVFRHAVSPFNPERFKKILGESLTLEALRDWLDAWLKANGRRLMHREGEGLDEFLLPESLRHRFSVGERSVKGTFDRARAIRDPSVSLLAFGHSAIDTIARQAMSPDAAGFLAAVRPPKDDTDFDLLVVALLQTETVDCASAHRVLYIKRDRAAGWSLADAMFLSRLDEGTHNSAAHALEGLRSSLEEFVQSQFADLDFVAEHLHYVAILAR